MSNNPYRKFVKICTVIAIVAGCVALIAGIVGAFVESLQKPLLFVAIAGALIAVVFLVMMLVGLNKASAKKDDEEASLYRDLRLVAKGEKKIIPEQGEFFKKVRKEINKANISKPDLLPYGDYPEEKFDEVVLDTLENHLIASAGLVYFELISSEPIPNKAPVDALLVMAKNYFGERAYYGKQQNGVAVFVPFLGSQEEMMGRVRKVVQLYSYSIEENHINVKAGIAFYPEIAPRNLTSSALKSTVNASPLQASAAESQVPLVGYKAAETVSILYAGKMMVDALQKPVSRAECKQIFEKFGRIGLSSLGADCVDIFTYDEAASAYRLEEEVTRGEGAGFMKMAEEDLVKPEILQPIFDWSVQEKGVVCASKAVYLPENVKMRLANLRMLSIMAYALCINGRPMGLIVVGSTDHEMELRYGAQRFFSYAERYLHSLLAIKLINVDDARSRAALGSFDHYAYAIQGGSYSLSYVSPNLKDAIPDAIVGRPCYEALFGSKEPCKDCPLFQIGVEKVMPKLASGVFAFRALPGEGETIMVVSPHKADFSSSRLDELTGLLSDASLHEDLQNEILIKSNHGQVLGFRIRNADTIRGGFRLQSTHEIVRLAAEALISARLARGVYRNGEHGFAYLLPSASKKEAIDLAEKVSKTLSAKIPFHDKQIELYLDFVLVSYPLEAYDTFTMDSLFRVLYSKADASSRGRLFEVEHPEGRMVDYNYYARVKLEEGLRAGIMPVHYRNYDELAGTRTAYYDAVVAVRDEDNNIIDEDRLLGIANSIGKGTDSYVAMARSIVKAIAKGEIDKPVILRIAPTCFNGDFMRKVDELWAKEGVLDRKPLIFQIEEDALKDENFASFKKMCQDLGYRLGLGSYKADLEENDLQDFLYVGFHASVVYGALKEKFLLGLSSVRSTGLNVMVHGFKSKQERHYLASLSFHYGLMDEAKEGEEDDNELEFDDID